MTYTAASTWLQYYHAEEAADFWPWPPSPIFHYLLINGGYRFDIASFSFGDMFSEYFTRRTTAATHAIKKCL